MTHHRSSIWAAVAFLSLSAASLNATTYYVSNAGNNGANGTSSNTAWLTLQHAAGVVHAGDTVIVLPGTYVGFNLFTSGAPGAPITFTANGGASTPNPAVVVNANNNWTNKDRINLEGASYVVVEGFTVIGTGDPATNRTGIRTVTASHVTVRANRIDLCGRWAILTGFVDDLLIENNECSRSAAEHGIYVGNSGDRPTVRKNVSWGNHSCGLHMNGDLSQGGDGIISDATVESNVIYENGNGSTAFGMPGGSAINCDGVQNSTFRNNLLYMNHKSGISLYQIDGGAPSTGNHIVHNTIRNASDSRWALNIQDASTGTVVVNNILLNDHSSHGAIDTTSSCLPGMISNHNGAKSAFGLDDNALTLAQWQAATGLDAQSFVSTAAALFTNPAAGDYTLKVGSPGIDAGQAAFAEPLDLLGKHRPALLGYDVGAYEFAACFGAVSSIGAGVPGTGGVTPTLATSGCPDPGATLSLLVANGKANAPGLLLVGANAASIPAYGGFLYLAPTLVLSHSLSAAGAFALPAAIPSSPSFTGATLRAQAIYADAGAAFGASLTAAIAIQFG